MLNSFHSPFTLCIITSVTFCHLLFIGPRREPATLIRAKREWRQTLQLLTASICELIQHSLTVFILFIFLFASIYLEARNIMFSCLILTGGHLSERTAILNLCQVWQLEGDGA